MEWGLIETYKEIMLSILKYHMYAFVFQNDLYKVDDILMSELTT